MQINISLVLQSLSYYGEVWRCSKENVPISPPAAPAGSKSNYLLLLSNWNGCCSSSTTFTTFTPWIFNSCFSSSAIRKQTIYLGKNNRNSGRRTDVSAWQMLRGEASTMRSYLSSKHLAPHPWRKTLIKKTVFSESVVLKYGFLGGQDPTFSGSYLGRGAYNVILSQLKAPWARGKFREKDLEKETNSFIIWIYHLSNPIPMY